MNASLELRILRSEAELERVRSEWTGWQQHPHADLDFFLTIVRARREVISPYVLALYRCDVLESLLVGRLEQGELPLSLGYLHLLSVPVRSLTFVYRGLLGNDTEEHCTAFARALPECLRGEGAQLGSLHFVKIGSPLHRAASRLPGAMFQNYLSDTRPHWVMKLPGDVEEIYRGLSPKARKNRRYELNRVHKEFPSVSIECFTEPRHIERVMADAEAIACRTYQRGLGVGYAPTIENRERFNVEAARGRFRAYILYLGGQPVAFFIGTLSRDVLYDNFTGYNPEYSKYSPGTVLFFEMFERLCREGVNAVDFGFGDSWYKAQFGTECSHETTLSIIAPTVRGVGLNLVRVPVAIADRLGKKAVQNISMFRSVKKRWRDRAQRRATA